MRLLTNMRRAIAAHACHYDTLPTISVPVKDHRSEDDREFDREFDYLRDLVEAIFAELTA